MTRVLVLVERFPAVSETFVTDHVVGLIASGFEVHVGCWMIDRVLLHDAERLHGHRLQVHALEAPSYAHRSKPWRTARSLARLGGWAPAGLTSTRLRSCSLLAGPISHLSERLDPDVVHAHFGHTGIAAAIALKRKPRPMAVDFHGFDVTWEVAQRGWRDYRLSLGQAVAVAHSTFVEERLRGNLSIPCRRITLGVDLARFSLVPRPERWEAPLRLLTVGRLMDQKGHHVAIDALALLRCRLPQLQPVLRIVGEGPAREALQRRVRLLGLESAVSFSGAQSPEQVAAAMAEAQVLLIPSMITAQGWQEAFCRVAVEGMARGCLVVGSASGGLPETLGGGGETLQGPQDAAGLCQAIVTAIHDRSPTAWADSARARATHFDLGRMHGDYARLTRELASR